MIVEIPRIDSGGFFVFMTKERPLEKSRGLQTVDKAGAEFANSAPLFF